MSTNSVFSVVSPHRPPPPPSGPPPSGPPLSRPPSSRPPSSGPPSSRPQPMGLPPMGPPSSYGPQPTNRNHAAPQYRPPQASVHQTNRRPQALQIPTQQQLFAGRGGNFCFNQKLTQPHFNLSISGPISPHPVLPLTGQQRRARAPSVKSPVNADFMRTPDPGAAGLQRRISQQRSVNMPRPIPGGNRPKPKPKPVNLLKKGKAMYPYTAQDTDEISLNQDDIIEIIKEDSSGWWTGRLPDGREGLFPGNYIEKI